VDESDETPGPVATLEQAEEAAFDLGVGHYERIPETQ